jgi:hypothetical protein
MEQLIDLLYLDELDPSGVIYPTDVVALAVQKIEERIKKTNGILGECGIPVGTSFDRSPDIRYQSIDMGRVSHIVRHVWIEKKRLKCKVKLLGQYAEIRELMPVSFEGIPRAIGVVEGKGKEKVCTEYTLITVDLAMTELE